MGSDGTGPAAAGGDAQQHARGSTQSGVRLYNERLILSLIRRHGSLPKAEMARLTGLSAQTVSVIVRHLESDGLLKKQTPQRGKVGQPLVPFSLDPQGAFSIGLKVGRRSADLLLMDLSGRVCEVERQTYAYPVAAEILRFVEHSLARLCRGLSRRQRERIAGIGIAAPFELWNWAAEVGAPRAVMEAWRGVDLAQEVGRLSDWPVQFCNDATAACAAELLFGHGGAHRDFAYFYLGYFIGGGIVMNGSLLQGRSGNAGALGSFPVPGPGGARQLIQTASFSVLEHALKQAGRDPSLLWRQPEDWGAVGAALDSWIETAAEGLALASAGVAAVFEPSATVIDGAMPREVRARLCRRVRDRLAAVDMQGITPFVVEEGSIGADARAMGAASLPLFANFVIDRDVLFKDGG